MNIEFIQHTGIASVIRIILGHPLDVYKLRRPRLKKELRNLKQLFFVGENLFFEKLK